MFGIVCDCHNTLLNSNEAWTQAFIDNVGSSFRDAILLDLYGRRLKRKEIARKYNADYETVQKNSNYYSKLNCKLFSFLKEAKDAGIPLFVVSNAPKQNIINDLSYVGEIKLFSKIYSIEDGGKKIWVYLTILSKVLILTFCCLLGMKNLMMIYLILKLLVLQLRHSS